MSKRINKSCVYIDGDKFKTLLETQAGKSLKEISLENGFSDSFLRMVVKSGKASPTAQAVARLYGIEPSEYEIKPAATSVDDTEGKQLTFDDLGAINRDELKEIVKEAIIETLNSIVCNEIAASYDALSHTYKIAIKVKKEALI
jgi:lambda repressor-like predicted transcriptional regulator